jgi:hypothetical protein
MNGAITIQQIVKRGFVKQICDKILQGIEKVQNAPDYEHRRWIWELMQNAKDVHNLFGGVSIKIELHHDRLIFSHNGVPFSLQQLSALVMQVSSKDDTGEAEETTGKFGTGFISTHMLSSLVKVRGIVDSGEGRHQRFEVELDRSGNNFLEMEPKVEAALHHILQLDDYEKFPVVANYQQQEQQFDTQFEYPLDARGLEIAKKGIEDLDVALPYTMIFVPKIKSVIIRDFVTGHFYEISLEQPVDLGSLRLHTFLKEYQPQNGYSEDASFEKLHIVSAGDGDFMLAQRIDAYGGQWAVRKNGEALPKIFRDFPLVGTGNFHLPAVLNSHKLYPTEPRDGVYLKNAESARVVSNRAIIESALPVLQRFMAAVIQAGWVNTHLLAVSALPENKRDYIDLAWYQERVQKPLRAFLVEQPLVQTRAGHILLKQARIPVYKESREKRMAFYHLALPFKPEVFPSPDTYLDWVEIVVPEYDTWGIALKYTLEDLVEEIASCGQLAVLQSRLGAEQSALSWLNQVIQFLLDEDHKSLLESHAILANQNGDFKKLPELRYDEGIPGLLLDVLKEIGTDWRAQLMHQSLIKIADHPGCGIKDISSAINGHIQEFSKPEATLTPQQESGLLRLAGYLTSEESNQRRQIWQFAQGLFPAQIAERCTVVPGTADFVWDSLNRWVIKKILKTLEGLGSVQKLSARLTKEEEDTLFYLNQVISFVFSNNDFKSYLDDYSVTPCQYGDFRLLKDMDNDPDRITEELKAILLTLSNPKMDWKAELLHPSIAINTGRSRPLSNICSEIDTLLITKRNEETLATQFKNQALQIINLIKREGQTYAVLFPRLYGQFAQIQVELMGEYQEAINQILQHEDKIGALAAVAQSGLSSNQIEELIGTAEELGHEKIMEIAREMLEEKRDFEFKRQIGRYAEDSFRALLEAETGLTLEVIQKDGAQDYIFRKAGIAKEYLLEIKSIAHGSTHVFMSKSQGQRAAAQPEAYCLCVIQRAPGAYAPSMEYFRQNARFHKTIGSLLKEKVSKATAIEQALDQAGDIEIDFVDRQYKFKLRESVWAGADHFDGFMRWLVGEFFRGY